MGTVRVRIWGVSSLIQGFMGWGGGTARQALEQSGAFVS